MAAMPVRAHEAMDKMSGVQQGLEASMTRHKDELSQRFGARLAHACKEAEDAAVERVQATYEPQLRALREQLEVHIRETHSRSDETQDGLRELAERHAGTVEALVALNTGAKAAAANLEEHSQQLIEEQRRRETSCKELDGRIFDFQSALVKESMAREEADERLEERLGRESARLEEAAQRALLRADEHGHRATEERAALEARLLQRLEEQAAKCLDQARRHTDDSAAALREGLARSASHTKLQVDASRAHADALVAAQGEALRGELASAAERVLAASEQAVHEKCRLVSAQLQGELEQSGNEAARATAGASASLWEAVAALEGRVADARSSCASELQALANGETLRLNFLNALQAQKKGPPTIQGGRSKVVDSDLVRTNPHVRMTLEVGLEEEVQELRRLLGDVDRRLCQEHDRLDAELRARATNHEVYTRLQAAVADLSSRVRTAHGEACDTRVRSQQELLALGGELTSVRAAATSLANGVLRALQILGLLDAAPGGPPAPCGGGECAERPNLALEAPGKSIRLEDLLTWEKIGNSLATKVTRQWRGREAAGIPTFVAALERVLQVETPDPHPPPTAQQPHTLLPVAPPPLAPHAPVRGAQPPGVAHSRHHHLSAAMA